MKLSKPGMSVRLFRLLPGGHDIALAAKGLQTGIGSGRSSEIQFKTL